MSSINGNGPIQSGSPASPSNPYGIQSSPLTFNDAIFTSQVQASIPPPPSSDIPLIKYYGQISEAQLQQALQEILTNFENATALSGMWKDAQDQAIALRSFINQIYAYVYLQQQVINNDNIDGQVNTLNQALTNYNTGVPNDILQTQLMNDAISAFNQAQNDYNTALQTHGAAVTAQQQAQNTYNTALQTWQAALEAFNSGQITDLSGPQAAFEAAQATFNAAQAGFSAEEASYNAALLNYQSALSTFQSAQTAFNAYAAARNPAIIAANQAIDQWNTFATAENIKITKLNDIRATLTPPLPPLPLAPILNNIPLLQTVSAPGISPLQQQIEQRIQQYNAGVTSTNTSLNSSLNPLINLINSTYALSLPNVPDLQPMNDIPLLAFGSDVPSLPTPTTINPINYSAPGFVDVITIYLEPRLVLIGLLKQSNEAAISFSNFTDARNDTSRVRDFAGQQNTLGGPGAGVSLTTLGRNAINTSPFLDQILSKQLYESIINEYGQRSASALVDWASALSVRLLAQSGLTAAGPGNKILDKTVYDNIKGHSAFNVAVSLGFLKQISNVTSGNFLPQSVLGFINNEPDLSNLSAAQKAELANLISGDISKNMLLIGLSDIARSLNLPGLTPQILAISTGLNTNEGLAALNNQVLAGVALSQALGKAFELSNAATDAISKAVLDQSIRTNAELEKTVLISSLQGELAGAGVPATAAQINEIADAVMLEIIHVRQQQQELQKDAFRHEVAFGLQQAQNLSGDDALKIVNRLFNPISGLNDLSQAALTLLPKQGLTDAETASIVNQARSAYLAKEPSANPLSSFALQTVGAPGQIEGQFTAALNNALSPSIGVEKAKDVTSAYAGLLFSSPTSVLDTLQAIYRHEIQHQVKNLNRKEADVQLDQFVQANKLYSDPGNYLEKITSPAKTFLAISSVGGPSMQGTSSIDNTLGPNLHYRHPTDIAV